MFCFPNTIMYTLNIATALRKMRVTELRDFIFENYYKTIGYLEGTSYYSMKSMKKIFVVACNQINRKSI